MSKLPFMCTAGWPPIRIPVVACAQRLANRKAGEAHPFVDNPTWRQWLSTAHAGTIKYIENAKAGRN